MTIRIKSKSQRIEEAEAREADHPAIFRAPIVELRSIEDEDGVEPGTYDAVVSVFGNVDSYGDRMRFGAFTRTLRPPPEGRGLPPVVWSHDWQTPPIGVSLSAQELNRKQLEELAGAPLPQVPDEGGLYKRNRLFVGDDEHVPLARHCYTAMRVKGGDGRPALREYSFGFRTVRAEWVEEDPDTLPPELQWTGGLIRDLVDVDLYEDGPTLVGANDATATLGIKAAIASLTELGLIDRDAARKALERAPAETPKTLDPALAARLAELRAIQPIH